MPKSRLIDPGARTMLRPEFPKQAQAGADKAVRSNQCVGSRYPAGRAPLWMRSGRAVVLVPEGSVLMVTVKGWPVCACSTAEALTDAAASYLRANKSRRKLVLRGVDITDVGMPYLGALTGLSRSISATR